MKFKDYIKRFKVLFIITGVVLVIFLIALFVHIQKASRVYTRGNNGCPTERVYDFADLLTDAEEDSLRQLIAESEVKIGADIIIVTMNQPLKDYALSFQDDVDYYISEDKYVSVWADNFYDNYDGPGRTMYDEDAFGFEEPYGSGALLIDNWDRSDSAYGYAYNWISTSGRVFAKFSTSDIQDIIDDVNDVVNYNPYKAYCRYVNGVVRKMGGSVSSGGVAGIGLGIFAGLISALIYCLTRLKRNLGQKTVKATTYVVGGKPQILRNEDHLINTVVTKHRISSSSGGGGGHGGSHHSSSGHSHGGGGGHH